MRLFVGIPVSGEIKEELKAVLQGLSGLEADLRVVAPENLHITGVFLGEANLEASKKKLRSLSGMAFSVPIQRVGAFPSADKPRVIWAGVLGKEIISLLQKIRQLFPSPDAPEELQPHITLARVKSVRNRSVLQQFIKNNSSKKFGEMRIEKIVLYQSTLTLQRAKYTALEEVFLA